jgi:hypothetical protein
MAISPKQNTVVLQLLATLKPIHYNLVSYYNGTPPHFIQELFPEDCHRRMECVEIMLTRQYDNPRLKTLFRRVPKKSRNT